MLFLILLVIACSMVALIAWVIRFAPVLVYYTQLFVILFVLTMMVSMFLGASVYLFYPSSLSLSAILGENMFVMVLGLIYVFENLQRPAKTVSGVWWRFALAILIVLNEFLMGFVFNTAQNGASILKLGSDFLKSLVNDSVNNYWFFLPLAAELVSVKKITKRLFYVFLAASMAFSPTILTSKLWHEASMIATAALWVGFFFGIKRWRYLPPVTLFVFSEVFSFFIHDYTLFAIVSVCVSTWAFYDYLKKEKV